MAVLQPVLERVCLVGIGEGLQTAKRHQHIVRACQQTQQPCMTDLRLIKLLDV